MTVEKKNSQPLISELAGDPDFAELLAAFLSEMPGRILALETALTASDLGTLARLTHQLKGSAGGYGYPIITQAARDVEQSAKAQAASDVIRNQVNALVDLCLRAGASQVSAARR